MSDKLATEQKKRNGPIQRVERERSYVGAREQITFFLLLCLSVLILYLWPVAHSLAELDFTSEVGHVVRVQLLSIIHAFYGCYHCSSLKAKNLSCDLPLYIAKHVTIPC